MNSSTNLNQSDAERPVAHNPSTGAAPILRLEEQLQVGTQTVETGHVILTKTVHQVDETVTLPLVNHGFRVERVALEQHVDQVPPTRQEGHTTVYSVVKEVLVVQKRLVLVEEVRVTPVQTQTEEVQTVHLRREAITVERSSTHPERPV